MWAGKGPISLCLLWRDLDLEWLERAVLLQDGLLRPWTATHILLPLTWLTAPSLWATLARGLVSQQKALASLGVLLQEFAVFGDECLVSFWYVWSLLGENWLGQQQSGEGYDNDNHAHFQTPMTEQIPTLQKNVKCLRVNTNNLAHSPAGALLDGPGYFFFGEMRLITMAPRRFSAGPAPTIADLQRQFGGWFWLHCHGCHQHHAVTFARFMILLGANATVEDVRRVCRCKRCGRREPTTTLPSWKGSTEGFARFPG